MGLCLVSSVSPLLSCTPAPPPSFDIVMVISLPLITTVVSVPCVILMFIPLPPSTSTPCLLLVLGDLYLSAILHLTTTVFIPPSFYITAQPLLALLLGKAYSLTVHIT